MSDPVYFSRVKLLDGSYAEVKDAVARQAMAGGMHFLGITTTALTDQQSVTKVTINSEEVTLSNGDIVVYNRKEFLYSSAEGKVYELGDLTGLGSLATKNSASGSYTPQGSVSSPNITVTPSTTKVAAFKTAGSVTAGTANVPTAVTVTAGTANVPTAVSVTAGTANVPTAVSVTNGTANVPTAVSVTNGTANVPTAVTLPTFSATMGANETLEFAWTAGSVTAGTAGVPTAVSVTEGTACTPTAVNVTAGTAGTPTAVSVTAGTAGVPTAVAVTAGTAGTPTAVTLPTSEEIDVMTGASAALASDPVFTGTAATITVS